MPSDHSTHRGGGVCPWWLCPMFDNPLRRLVHKPERSLAGLVQPGQTALDLGCGMGYFSIPLARLVGPRGKVICVDLQEEMLAEVRRRAKRAGVSESVILHRATSVGLGLNQPADFVLAFWMLHETPDQVAFLAEVRTAMRNGGRLFVVEPRLHVTASAFERSLAAAQSAGCRSAQGRAQSGRVA